MAIKPTARPALTAPRGEFRAEFQAIKERIEALDRRAVTIERNVTGVRATSVATGNTLRDDRDSDPDEATATLYVGPAAFAPSPTFPILMILRETGAPADQTSIVVREP